MGLDKFVQTSVSVQVGHNLAFQDNQRGAEHILCIGSNGQCTPNAQGPSLLTRSGGLIFEPGVTQALTWLTPGTYHITCTIHPQMNLIVTVRGSASSTSSAP